VLAALLWGGCLLAVLFEENGDRSALTFGQGVVAASELFGIFGAVCAGGVVVVVALVWGFGGRRG
jgi:hypothetical protein